MTHLRHFFSILRVNPNQPRYDIWLLIKSTNVIIQQICIIFLTIALYTTLLYNLVDNRYLMVFGAIAFVVISPSELLSSILLMTFLAGISPILKTLTKTVSTDSVYYMAGLLYMLNLILKSYIIRNNNLLKDGFSMNAGYCASVLLASRLNNIQQVFTLLMLSVCLLCYIPYFTNTINSPFLHKLMTTGLLCFTLFSWIYLHEQMAWLIIVIVVCISGISPMLFLYLQKYKRVLAGPWDESKIT